MENKYVEEGLRWALIIGTLSTISFVSYTTGHHNGEIQQCLDLGMVHVDNTKCINKLEYVTGKFDGNYDNDLQLQMVKDINSGIENNLTGIIQ